MAKQRPPDLPGPFAEDLDEAAIRRERQRARELRRSQWWKRKLAKGECYWCGRQTAPSALSMDHVVPISRGGRSVKGNVVPACKACNTKKKQLLPIEWDAYLASCKAPSSKDQEKEPE